MMLGSAWLAPNFARSHPPAALEGADGPIHGSSHGPLWQDPAAAGAEVVDQVEGSPAGV
jgi:hypothetical protein